MAKHHGGTHHVQGRLNRGPRASPNPIHAGTGQPLGKVHGPPQPRQYVVHGGTALRQGVLNKK